MEKVSERERRTAEGILARQTDYKERTPDGVIKIVSQRIIGNKTKFDSCTFAYFYKDRLFIGMTVQTEMTEDQFNAFLARWEIIWQNVTSQKSIEEDHSGSCCFCSIM